MDKNTLKSLLNNFAKEEKIFTNEQDFQFELASALLKLENVKEVKLEALSVSANWKDIKELVEQGKKIPREKKEYTDILVKEKNGDWFALELKYKLPYNVCYYKTTKENILTMSQGDYLIGSYEVIDDIQRLENIKYRNFTSEIDIKKSFAILLTNDKNYRYNDFSGSSIWTNYSLSEKKKNYQIQF